MRRVGDRRSTWIEKLPVRRRMEAARDKERAKKGLAEPAECGLNQSVPIGVRFFSRVPHPHLLGVLGRDAPRSTPPANRRRRRSALPGGSRGVRAAGGPAHGPAPDEREVRFSRGGDGPGVFPGHKTLLCPMNRAGRWERQRTVGGREPAGSPAHRGPAGAGAGDGAALGITALVAAGNGAAHHATATSGRKRSQIEAAGVLVVLKPGLGANLASAGRSAGGGRA